MSFAIYRKWLLAMSIRPGAGKFEQSLLQTLFGLWCVPVLLIAATTDSRAANMQLVQAGPKLDFSESVGGSIDELLPLFQQMNIRYSVNYVSVCDGSAQKTIESIEPTVGTLTTQFVLKVKDKGVRFPELLGGNAVQAKQKLQDMGFQNVAIVGDGNQVTSVEPGGAGECVSVRVPVTIDTTVHRSGTEVVNACEQSEMPRIFNRSQNNKIHSYGVDLGVYETVEPDIKETMPPSGFILSRMLMLDSSSPYYFAIFSSLDQSEELLFRSYCRSNNEVVSEYSVSSGAFSMRAQETAEAVGFQLDDTVILVWQINDDEWFNVYTKDSVHDFTLTMDDKGLQLYFLSESGEVWRQGLNATEKSKKMWSLGRSSQSTDQLISFGDSYLLVSKNGWRRFSLGSSRPGDSHLDDSEKTIRVDKFFTPDGLTSGFAAIRKKVDVNNSNNTAQIVWRDRDGKFRYIDGIELPGIESDDASVYALPASSDMRRINLIVAYNRNDIGQIRCYSAYRPLGKKYWIAVPGKKAFQLENHIDMERVQKVRLNGQEVISYASNEFSFGISFRNTNHPSDCWS